MFHKYPHKLSMSIAPFRLEFNRQNRKGFFDFFLFCLRQLCPEEGDEKTGLRREPLFYSAGHFLGLCLKNFISKELSICMGSPGALPCKCRHCPLSWDDGGIES